MKKLKSLIKDNLQKKIKNNFLDNFNDSSVKYFSYKKKLFYQRTLNLWGKESHKKNKDLHNVNIKTHIEMLFKYIPMTHFKGNLLEIGCGEGIDMNYLLNKNNKIKGYYAIDIGENIYNLRKKLNDKRIFFSRSDCQYLPFKNNVFDIIYSYGVYHHTHNIEAALKESRRVLKIKGEIIFYSYKKQKYILKRLGIHFETILMKIFSNINYSMTKIILYFFSPIILLFFSYPSKFFALIGYKNIQKRFPLWWGTTPNSIIFDLLDRLYSPINRRYNENELNLLLHKLNFNNIKFFNDVSGLIAIASK